MKTPVWNPQVRWYDHFFAWFLAHWTLASIQVMLMNSFDISSIIVAVIVNWTVWNIWNGWYCKKFRMRQEFEKFSAEVEQHMNDLLENRND